MSGGRRNKTTLWSPPTRLRLSNPRAITLLQRYFLPQRRTKSHRSSRKCSAAYSNAGLQQRIHPRARCTIGNNGWLIDSPKQRVGCRSVDVLQLTTRSTPWKKSLESRPPWPKCHLVLSVPELESACHCRAQFKHPVKTLARAVQGSIIQDTIYEGGRQCQIAARVSSSPVILKECRHSPHTDWTGSTHSSVRSLARSGTDL